MAITPSVPGAANLFLGEGKIYVNYGEVSEAELGATRGGSSFSVEKDIKEIEYDGSFGPTKGLRRKLTVVPRLTVNALELNATNLPQIYSAMTVTDNTTFDTLTEDLDIVAGDYLTNIAFVGENLNGDDVIVIVKNALGDGNLEMAFEAKEEVVAECQFTGHYDSSTPTEVPYEIRIGK